MPHKERYIMIHHVYKDIKHKHTESTKNETTLATTNIGDTYSCDRNTHVHACTRTHAHMHTRMHAHTYTPTHTHAQTYTHACTHMHTHAHTYHTHTCIHIRTRTHTHTGGNYYMAILQAWQTLNSAWYVNQRKLTIFILLALKAGVRIRLLFFHSSPLDENTLSYILPLKRVTIMSRFSCTVNCKSN